MTIREKWITLRKQNRISVAEVSRRSGVSRNMISLYEKNQSNLSAEKLERMINSLGSELIIKTEM